MTHKNKILNFPLTVGEIRQIYVPCWLGQLICITISQLVRAKMQIVNEILWEVASGIESLAE